MAAFIPKEIPESSWQQLNGLDNYAVRSQKDDQIVFRFGQGHGVFISVQATTSGARLINGIDFETGDQVLIGQIPVGKRVVLGRTTDCDIRIMHAIVSRQHIKFSIEGDILVVQDAGSTNGTYFLEGGHFFNMDVYLREHPLDKAVDQTLDFVHETFGPTLDDFLKNYSQKKETGQ